MTSVGRRMAAGAWAKKMWKTSTLSSRENLGNHFGATAACKG